MRILVLGAGVIGVTSAYYLAREGFEVTVIDRQPAPALETSYANAGQVSPGYAAPWAAPGIPLKAIKWLFQKHAPLFMSLPVVRDNVRRYVQQHTLDVALPGLPPTTIDGVTELWFDDVDAVARVFTAPSYLATIRPDEETFLDLHRCELVLSEEHLVHG